MKDRLKNNNFTLGIIAFAISFICIYVFYYIFDLLPFGSGTLATGDAEIQYIDFFSYFKDILTGNNSVSYTYSDTLGGDTLAIFSYYLASPFNLLLFFFSKSNILTFFNLISALKISMCALTMGIFLSSRFERKLKPVYVILLSLSYAFMQYNLSQVDNIMWLDGVYMLPLILLGVYKAVNYRNIILLSVSAGLCIIFNWYIAGMCCLFSIIWFFFEYALKCLDKNGGEFYFKDMLVSLFLYGGGMVLALILSAGLFLPTVASMLGGKSVDYNFINEFTGNIFNVISKYQLGAFSSYGAPALYCGSTALIGAVALFFAKGITRKHKVVFGAMFFIMLMTFFWQPLYMVFSLLRSIGSFLIRHAFLSIFALIFMAAYFFKSDVPDRTKYIFVSAFSFSAVLMLLEYFNPSNDLTRTYYTVIFAVLAAFVLILIPRIRAVSVIAVFLLLVELGFNSKLILVLGHGVDYKEETHNYQVEQQKQIDEIKSKNSGFYRIAQTVKRTGSSYNDSFAYGFASNTGFTSCPDNLQLDFLDRMGYRNEGECITVVGTPILAADALLGVKYVLSDKPVDGLVKADGIRGYNGNTVYENPYCLPMAYVIDKYEETEYKAENPFDFHNEIYSNLLGEKTELYKRIKYEIQDTEGGFLYTLDMPRGNYVLYGNIDFYWSGESSVIDLNGSGTIKYGSWLSRSVFNVPAKSGQKVKVEVTTSVPQNFKDAQFCVLDLDKLKTVTDLLSSRSALGITFDRDRIYGSVQSENGGFAVLSVPYSENWDFEINGQSAVPLTLGDGLMVLPLAAGNNDISAKYSVPFLALGIIISVIGILMLIVIAVITYNKKIRDRLFEIINSRAVRYLIAGGATTLVNLIVFTLLCRVLHIEVNISNVISVISAILFAYVINKIFVFRSKCPSPGALLAEFVKFVGARGITMIIEVGGVFLLYNIIGQNELIAKLETQVVVLIANYVISKFLVFKNNIKGA